MNKFYLVTSQLESYYESLGWRVDKLFTSREKAISYIEKENSAVRDKHSDSWVTKRDKDERLTRFWIKEMEAE